MIDALHIAETGMNSYTTYLDVISNNIANINTPGFKKTNVNFSDMVYKSSENNEVITSETIHHVDNQVGMGAAVANTYKVFSEGQMVQTNNPMDVAILGQGFLEVELPDGTTAYTRNGNLSVDQSGQLGTKDGYTLSSSIRIPPDVEAIAISNDGIILAKISGESKPMELGQIELARFSNPEGLNSLGLNLYTASEQSGSAFYSNPGAQGSGTLLQGYQETSNVDLTQEMVNMMTAQRAFQLNSRVIQVADQMLETINNLRR